MQRLDELAHHLVGRPALDGERTLADRRQHDLAGQDLGRMPAQVEAFEAAQRQNQCIDFTGLHLAQPRVHIPADRHDR